MAKGQRGHGVNKTSNTLCPASYNATHGDGAETNEGHDEEHEQNANDGKNDAGNEEIIKLI